MKNPYEWLAAAINNHTWTVAGIALAALWDDLLSKRWIWVTLCPPAPPPAPPPPPPPTPPPPKTR